MSQRNVFYYDQASNLSCVRDPDLGLTYYEYDLLDRVTSVKNPFGEVTYYEYTPGGQVKQKILGNGTVSYYEYDAARRVSRIQHVKSDLSEIATLDYEYDRVGNPTKIVREDGSATYYLYDNIYQLTGETQVGSGGVEYAFEYDYDGAHNRTVKVVDGVPTYYTYNAANELLTETTGGETIYYHYDGCGNTVAKQEASGTTYYRYNTENLMTRIDFAAGSNYYEYDADSKRVSQRTADGFRQFVYQGPDMLKLQMERDESEQTVAHYTMGAGLEAMRRETSSFYHYNHLGTTLALTGADEAVSDTYRHDAWGVLLASTGSTVNPHTYVGQQRYYRMGLAAGTHFVTVTRDHEQVPHTVSDFAEDLVVCDVPESINTDAASFVSGLEADYSDLRVFASDGITPVAFGVKEFSQTSGSEVLRIAVHSDSISTTADESWVIARGCTPHPTNATWEDRASVVAEDCEGYWPMGGTEDWTANENDGSNTNGTVADGQVANATSFSGNGWYDCGTDSSLRISGDLTVVAWARPNSGGSGHICAKGTGGDYTHMYEFRWDPDGRLRLIGGNEAGDGYGFRPYTAADVVVDETWNCCAAVIDGSGIRMYVDGVEKHNSSSAVTSRQVNDDTFYIGRRGDGWMNASGRIDEMQVYSGARSADWIEVYYAMTSDPGAWASVTSEQAVADASMYHLGFRDYAQGVGRFTTVDPIGTCLGSHCRTDMDTRALPSLQETLESSDRMLRRVLRRDPALVAPDGSGFSISRRSSFGYVRNQPQRLIDAEGLQDTCDRDCYEVAQACHAAIDLGLCLVGCGILGFGEGVATQVLCGLALKRGNIPAIVGACGVLPLAELIALILCFNGCTSVADEEMSSCDLALTWCLCRC